jgi:hypothetical protein
MPTCYTCHEEITFDKNIKSKTGKQIPLWPDKQNAHGHDEEGNAIRQKLPFQSQQQQQQQSSNVKSISHDNLTPTDVPIHSQGGPALDTKRTLQAIVELTKELREFKEEIRNSVVVIDSGRYENQMKAIYDVMAPLLNTQVKTASELYKDTNDPTFINHAKRADDYQNFMQNTSKSTNTNKVFNEKGPDLDESIPDSKEYQDLVGMKVEEESDIDEGVYTED